MTLLKKTLSLGVRCEVSVVHTIPRLILFLPHVHGKISTTVPGPHLPACCHAPQNDGYELILWDYKPPLRAYPYKLPWP